MSVEYHRKHYLANKSRYFARNKKYKQIFDAILEKLKDRPCADCGERFPTYVMDFDHIRGKKVISISRLRGLCSPALLLSEVKKCEVVCANCHRLRTHKNLRHLTIEEIVQGLVKRRKVYDRKIWEELLMMIGITMPPLPPPPARRSRCVRKIGPEGTAWCSLHVAFISIDKFEKNASRWNGLQSQCVDCRKRLPSRISKRDKRFQKAMFERRREIEICSSSTARSIFKR